MKRIFSVILCAAILLSMLPVPVAALAQWDMTSGTIVPECDLPANDILFEGYLDQLFFDESVTFGIAAGQRLTGDEKLLYDALIPYIKKIASGDRESTVISVGKTVTDTEGTEYIAEAEVTFTGGVMSDESLERVFDALLLDLPYELYWYDKVTGANFYEIHTSKLIQICVMFSVADNYASGADYSVDPALASAAAGCLSKAEEIIKSYASCTDYEKLLGYRDEICALVSYDDAAAEGDYFSTDNDPWQLIHVFDEDPETNVVCEGYSKAFMYLCDRTVFTDEILCYTVLGTLNGENHMWNVVSINGKNYFADVTNSDDGTSGDEGGLFLSGASGSAVKGYTVKGIFYQYDADILALWGSGEDSILTLQTNPYSPSDHFHDYTNAVSTPPTCTKDGFTTFTCGCGDSYTDDIVPASGHSFRVYVFDGNATCLKDGTKTAKCDNCDETDTIVDSGSATGHNWDEGTVSKEPAVGVEGIKTFTCGSCGMTKTESIAALPDESCKHGSVKLVNQKNASCTQAGYTGNQVCTACGETVKQGSSISVKPHSEMTDPAVAPTCIVDGKTEGKHCSVCKTILVKQETVAATGHHWSDWTETKPATGAEEGQEKRRCSVCEQEETRTVDRLTHPFVDVAPGSYYEVPIFWAVENGVTSGIDATHFGPNATSNRGHVVTFLWRAAGSPEPVSDINPFKDVKEDQYYYKAVLWAVEKEITMGTSANTFSPNDNCTRGQVATFLWRTLDKPAASSASNPFKDVTQGNFYTDAVLWAVEAGVTKGTTETTFSPEDCCSRGQIVTFLHRALG